MIDICIYSTADTVKSIVDMDEEWAQREHNSGHPMPSITIIHTEGGDENKVRHFMTLAQFEALRDQLIMALPMVSADLGKKPCSIRLAP